MAGYLGSKAVLLSTTAAVVTGDMTVAGATTLSGAFTSLGIDDNATSTAITIDGSQNVGIGTATPATNLDVTGAASSLQARFGGTAGRGLEISTATTFSTPDAVTILNAKGSTRGTMVFQTESAEAMRIDSSGNLLVGTTNSTPGVSDTDVGCSISGGGFLFASREAGTAAYFNRNTSDGTIIDLRKNGSTVGSIGYNGQQLYIVSGAGAGFAAAGPNSAIIPTDGNGNAADNAKDVGASTIRFDDVYATNGTIQTSDANEKQQIAALTDAEMTAAKAISQLFKTFKWNDSVAEKGADAARTHTGVIAQEVEQAMTDAGLDAGDYAFFISTTWWETQTEVPAVEAVEAVYEDVVIPAVLDDDGNELEAERTEQRLVTEVVEGKEAYTRTDTYDTLEEAPEGATERNRRGIRYPQLLSFVGAATEQRLASIETRLAALEVTP